MSTVTFGIFASVDAGKTTLSESILYQAGIIDSTGRDDKGDAFWIHLISRKNEG